MRLSKPLERLFRLTLAPQLEPLLDQRFRRRARPPGRAPRATRKARPAPPPTDGDFPASSAFPPPAQSTPSVVRDADPVVVDAGPIAAAPRSPSGGLVPRRRDGAVGFGCSACAAGVPCSTAAAAVARPAGEPAAAAALRGWRRGNRRTFAQAAVPAGPGRPRERTPTSTSAATPAPMIAHINAARPRCSRWTKGCELSGTSSRPVARGGVGFASRVDTIICGCCGVVSPGVPAGVGRISVRGMLRGGTTGAVA